MKDFFRKIRHKRIVKKLAIPKDASILDTSCQDGSFLSTLIKSNSDSNIKVSGIDISQSDIESAKKLVPNGVFEVANNASIPFPDKSFDMVVSSFTLHHMNDPVSSLLDMKRVLKENGSIYIIDIIAEGKTFNFLLKKIKCPEPYHFEKFYSLKEVQELLIKTGLIISEKKEVLVFPLFTIIAPVLILDIKIQK